MLENSFLNGVIEHWPVWLVTVVLVVAAAIDGWQLKVPNWITFPMVLVSDREFGDWRRYLPRGPGFM